MLSKIRESLLKWRDDVDALEVELEAKLQRLEFLQEAPLPAEELAEAVIDVMLSHARKSFYSHLDLKLHPAVTNPLADPEATSWLPALITSFGRPNEVSPWSLLWVLREPITQALREEIINWDAMPEAGPPRIKREAEIPKLEKRIKKLRADIESEREAARQAGVELGQIHNRPSEKEKRSADA